MVGDERATTRRDKGRKTLHEVREDEAGDAVTDALTTALIWVLFLLVIPPVSAMCWVVIWWHGN